MIRFETANLLMFGEMASVVGWEWLCSPTGLEFFSPTQEHPTVLWQGYPLRVL